MKKVAVVLPCYNSSQFLIDQVDSIMKQEGVSVHLYLSDDFSSDDTVMLMRRIEHTYKSSITILKNHTKFGNAGKHFYHLIKKVPLSKYDYLALSDHDDLWHRDKLLRATTILNDDFQGYSSSFIALYENNVEKYVNKAYPQKKYDFLFESPGPGSTFVLKKKLANSLKSFLNTMDTNNFDYHDWMIYAYARSRNFKWYIDPYPTIYYRQHNNNVLGVNLGFRAHFRRLKLVTSGWWLNQVQLLCMLLGTESSKEFARKYFKNKMSKLKLLFIALHCRRRFIHTIFFIYFVLLSK